MENLIVSFFLIIYIISLVKVIIDNVLNKEKIKLLTKKVSILRDIVDARDEFNKLVNVKENLISIEEFLIWDVINKLIKTNEITKEKILEIMINYNLDVKKEDVKQINFSTFVSITTELYNLLSLVDLNTIEENYSCHLKNVNSPKKTK